MLVPHSHIKRCVLFVSLLVWATGAVRAQEPAVKLPAGMLTGERVMAEVTRQTGYRFAYETTVFNPSAKISFESGSFPLDEVLSKVFDPQFLNYFLYNKVVVVVSPNQRFRIPLAPTITQRTMDRYRGNAPGEVGPAPLPRPETTPEPEPEPVWIDSVVVPVFPESYSNYKELDRYGHIYRTVPRFALKTNLLYTGVTLTPNLAFEFGVGDRSTVEFSGSYSWRGRKKDNVEDYKQSVHMILRPEYRYWLCERYNGHFFGVHATYGRYNISGYDIPMLFKKEHRYDGHLYGAGLTYGYQWAFAKRWGLEFNVGVGYWRLDYDKFDCETCGRDGVAQTKNYFGPTRAGITLTFLFK